MNWNARSLTWTIAIGVLGAALAVLFLFDPASVSIYPQCLFRRATGLDCPGCGGLRAAHQLLHGNVQAAFHLNPFFLLLAPVLLAVALRGLWLRRQKDRTDAVRPVWIWIFCAALIVFGVLRNLDRSPSPSPARVNAPLAESNALP